jgi:hypothetical protein
MCLAAVQLLLKRGREPRHNMLPLRSTACRIRNETRRKRSKVIQECLNSLQDQTDGLKRLRLITTLYRGAALEKGNQVCGCPRYGLLNLAKLPLAMKSLPISARVISWRD